jgi:ABC-2 type transport system permease protein
MIGPVFRISWLALIRDRYALVLSFVVPIAFFSILAIVFGGLGRDGLPAIHVAVVDEDRTAVSALLVKAVRLEASLAVEVLPPNGTAPSREEARRLVQRGDVPVAVVVPAGFGERFARFTPQRHHVGR